MKSKNKITKEDVMKMNRQLLRQQMAKGGFFMRSNNVTHRSKKDYTRKKKHKNDRDICR